VIRKLLTAVVAFGTTIPNRPSIVWMLPMFGLLDKRSSTVYVFDVIDIMTCKNVLKLQVEDII
jgi:hypothetical protein